MDVFAGLAGGYAQGGPSVSLEEGGPLVGGSQSQVPTPEEAVALECRPLDDVWRERKGKVCPRPEGEAPLGGPGEWGLVGS